MSEVRKPVRWWPVFVTLALGLAALVVVWFVLDTPRQQKNIRTAMVGMAIGALLFAWLILFSRARWKVRWGIAAILFLLGLAAASSLEIRGVTGDLIPIVEFRWKARHTVHAVQVQPAATNTWRKVPGEFPGFYGPNRDASLPGASIETDWTKYPPKLLWKIPVGQAWSGFAVKDGLAVTQEQRENSESVVCYEVVTGRAIWTHSDDVRYSTTIAGEGPRATPTIISNRVFTFGATGVLNCLDLVSGKLVWARNTSKEDAADIGDWGAASSPLVAEGLVILSIGGQLNRSLVAYRAETGEFVWGSGQAGADYSSPVLRTIAGTNQILIFNSFGVVANDLAGKELWKYKWAGGHPHISPPIAVGTNRVLVSSGYGTGAELLKVDQDPAGKWTVGRVWKSLALKSKFGPLFLKDDFVFGLDDGILTCIDAKTGQRRWKDGRYGHGQGLLLANVILFTSEKGEIVLIQPDPDKLLELSRFQVFSDKTWNPPALAGEYLLVRNHKEAACLQLSPEGETEKKLVLLFANAVPEN